MNNEKIQTIGERMAARKTEATAKCNVLIWANADADEIAQAAIFGGLDPSTLDAKAVQVAEAKAQIQAAIQANDRLPKLNQANNAAKSDVAKKSKEFDAAKTALEAAESAAWDTSEAVRVEQSSIDAGIQLFVGGTIPDGEAPEFLIKLAQRQKEAEAKADAADRAGQVKYLIRGLENRIAGLENELAEEKSYGAMAENVAVTPGGLIPLRSSLESKLKVERENLKTANANLVILEKLAQ